MTYQSTIIIYFLGGRNGLMRSCRIIFNLLCCVMQYVVLLCVMLFCEYIFLCGLA